MTITTGVGLISGIDFESYIEQITAINQRPIQIIQSQMSVKNAQSEAFTQISTQLSALRTQLQAMLEPEDFEFRSATSSDEDVITIDAEDTAAEGSYNVRVRQLAQAHRIGSQGVESLTSSIASASGQVKIQIGTGAVRTYNVDSNTTLTALRDMINEDTQSNVTASIINDGSATNPYRLVLTSDSTGASNEVTLLQNDTNLDFANKTIEAATADSDNQFDGTVTSSGTYTGTGSQRIVARITTAGGVDGAARFEVSYDGGVTFSGDYAATSTAQDITNGEGVEIAFAAGTADFAVGDTFSIDVFDPTIAKAQDAIITVDGVTVSRSTNTFSDVVDGVTFTAHSVSSETVSTSVNFEEGLLTAEVLKFQQAYNNALSTLESLSAYDAESKTASILFGDSTVRSLESMLRSIVSTEVYGIDTMYTTLASIGLGTTAGGIMGYDQTTMNEALENVENIMKIFGRIGDSTSTQVRLSDTSADTPADDYYINVTQAASKATVTGNQAIQSSGIATDENLTFTYDDNTFTVNLTAGDTTDAIVEKLNQRFDTENAELQAVNDNGVLRIETTAYGSEAEFSVISDAEGGTATQAGIGTTLQEVTGTDVEGTINGAAATGSGQTLSLSNGLEILVTSSAPITATVTYTRGIADTLLDQLNQYLDSDGLIEVRQDTLQKAMDRQNARIETLEGRIEREADRLRNQFIAMETQISEWNNIGQLITNSLSALNRSDS